MFVSLGAASGAPPAIEVAGYFSKDEILKGVEFLFNRTYKKAFGPKSSRIICFARALDSKRSDLVQLADIMLACSAISHFSLTYQSPAKQALLQHFISRKNSSQVTQRGEMSAVLANREIKPRRPDCLAALPGHLSNYVPFASA